MKITLYIIGALLLVGSSAVPVLLSQSFQGNDFKDADGINKTIIGWSVVKGNPITNVCSGTRIFGGFKSLGKDGAMVKVFQTPPHSQIQIKLQFWKIYSWDNEQFHVWVDDQRVFNQAFVWRKTKNICGVGDMDEVLNIDVTLKHTGTSAIVVMTSNLDETSDNEAWGIRDFQILVEKCPDGCSACITGESAEQCKVWEVAKNFWGALEVEKIGAEGWNVAGGPSQSTQCAGVSLFGGFNQWGKGAEIKGVAQLKPHYRLKTKLLFAKIDSWDNEIASFKIDGQEVWKRGYTVQEGYHTAICNFQHDWRQLFTRVEVETAHVADKVEFGLSTTLNQAPNDEAWGIRDFFVFIAQCPAFCNKCKGAADCQECAPNYTIKDGICVEIQNFLVVEQSFFDNVFAGLNDWVLKGNKEGRLVSECGGKYLVGGFNVLGKGGVAEKNYKLPGHKRVKIQMNLYKIDSWDNEFMFIKIDGVEVWKQQWTVQTGGGNLCGQGVWNDHIQYVEQIYAHTSPNLNLQLTSNLDEDPENESWGFRDFKLFIEPREECAVLFTQANFEGTPFSLCSSTANFAEERIPSQIKSVKVPPQGKVTLYSNNDYFGKKFIFTEDTPEINEEVYSFAEVEKRWIETQEI